MEINYESWKIQYKPISNPLKDKSDEHDDEDYQIHWHTIEENDLIKDHIGSGQIWTVIEGDRNSLYLVSGYKRVNRMYHYITQIPYTENIEIVLFEGYPEITKDDLDNLKSIKHLFVENVKLSLDKIIEYIERTGLN